MATAKVLLVDDEIDFTDALAARMSARGLEVDAVSGGADAIERVKETKYDVIVLDLMMPQMDGLETLKRLLSYDSDLQIIMLTGHGSVKQGVEAVKNGAVDFIEKPAEIEMLMGKIQEAQQVGFRLLEQNLDQKISDITKKRGW